MVSGYDSVAIQFSPQSLWLLNAALGFLVFAVSLYLEGRELISLRNRPRAAVAGLIGQWIWLPAITIVLILVIRPDPGLAMGMLMVASCPGGNVSNFFCLMARGNVVLSLGLTTFATLAAAVMTPTLFALGTQFIDTSELPPLSVSFLDMVANIAVVIVIPLIAALWLRNAAPKFAGRIRDPIRRLAGLVLLSFIVISLVKNIGTLSFQLSAVFALVALHNACALGGGYLVAALMGLEEPERRTVTIETGIQNSGLALVLIFGLLGGNPAMALIAAWWGVWHLLAGGALAWWWSRRPIALRLDEA